MKTRRTILDAVSWNLNLIPRESMASPLLKLLEAQWGPRVQAVIKLWISGRRDQALSAFDGRVHGERPLNTLESSDAE